MPGTIALMPGTIAPMPGTIAPMPGTIAPMPGTIAPMPGTIAPMPGTIAPMPGTIAPMPGTIAPMDLQLDLFFFAPATGVPVATEHIFLDIGVAFLPAILIHFAFYALLTHYNRNGSPG